jgi:magnesium-transporting ATPase (P-type)
VKLPRELAVFFVGSVVFTNQLTSMMESGLNTPLIGTGPGRRSSVLKSRTFSIRNVTGAMAPKPEPFDPDRIARTRTIALQHASRKIEDFTHVEWRAVVSDLATHSEKGLSADEAAQRLARHGPNELTKEPPTPFWKLFLEQFTDLLVILLIIACIVSMFLKEFEAGSFILIIVIINAVLGSVVEYSASDSLDQLEKMSADKATVIRDGIQVDVPANSLVPGDVVVLINGCKCPADVRLISSEELSTEEAALTGEAAEVKKDAEHVIDSTNESGGEEGKLLSAPNMCYMACSITSGHGKGVVVKTGMQTYLFFFNDFFSC